MSVSDSFSVAGPGRSARLGGIDAEIDERAARVFERIAAHGLGSKAGRGGLGLGLTLAMVAVDLVAIALGFGAAVLVADLLRSVFHIDQVASWQFLDDRARELVFLAALAIGVFGFGGLYGRGDWDLDEVKRIIAGVALLGAFDTMLQYMLRDHNSRLWFVAAYPIVALSVISLRMALRSLPPVRRAITNHVVLLGSGIAPDLLLFELRESRTNPVRLLESVPLSRIERHDPQRLEKMLDQTAERAGVPAWRLQIVLAPKPEEIAGAQDLLDLLSALRRPYGIILPFGGLACNGLKLRKVIGADMVMAEMTPSAAHPWPHALKRLFDVVVTTVGLVVLLPLLAVLAALLAFEGGPVLFSQTRIGRDGRRFRCWKFRTMRPDAEDRLQELLANDPAARMEWERYQKLRNDPRITPVGRFLRGTSLDELPQLLNVLLGDMSLVGPRPIVAPEVSGYPKDRAYYESKDFAYYVRCLPGLTGLWQVSGRNETSHDERIRLDRWYARNHSIWLDLVILLKTVRVVLGRSGSA